MIRKQNALKLTEKEKEQKERKKLLKARKEKKNKNFTKVAIEDDK